MELPEMISESDLKTLLARLKSGDETVKEAITLGHLRLAVSIARRWTQTHPSQAMQIMSDAMYGVIYAVEHAATKLYDDNITAYIASSVVSKIRNGLEKRFLVRVPRSATIMPFVSATKFKASATYGSVAELREVVYSCAANELEAHIMWLRETGHTFEEIATITGKSQTSVQRLLNQIHIRFQNQESA